MEETKKNRETLEAPITESEVVKDEAVAEEKESVEMMSVMIHPVPHAVRTLFEGMITELLQMQGEIEEKQVTAYDQNTLIGARINRLVEKYQIEVNRSHYEHFVKSIATYMQLLHDIRHEFVQEIALCRYVVGLQEPTLYEMPVTTDLEMHKWFLGHDALTEQEKNRLIIEKVQQVKRYIKTVKKDLRVSFSRYLYGFDAQMKQVERIELSMILLEQRKQHAQAHHHEGEHQAEQQKSGVVA